MALGHTAVEIRFADKGFYAKVLRIISARINNLDKYSQRPIKEKVYVNTTCIYNSIQYLQRANCESVFLISRVSVYVQLN